MFTEKSKQSMANEKNVAQFKSKMESFFLLQLLFGKL